MDNFFFMAFLLALAGIAIAIQSGCNSTLGRIAGKTFSSVNSFITGLVPLFVIFLIESKGITETQATAETVARIPWWGWIGGFLGTVYVLSQIFVVPKIGAANFTGLLVSTQLTTAVLMDNWGIAGVPQRTLT
ncbi:hypothetical protein K7432_008313 [Basidiobolus ranarum]|uniref:DMT family transporter n=1 Tax=Basidiobolus ranarum TaxID=34480 RepID=A0ABR2VYT5_9FUNG